MPSAQRTVTRPRRPPVRGREAGAGPRPSAGATAARWTPPAAGVTGALARFVARRIPAGGCATPADLRAAPGTAGRPPHGSRVAIHDELGRPLPAGGIGRIFAGNGMTFDGYTDGRGREVIDGMMSTGDVGHLDDAGRLFVDGREDDMIVSGAENVFPSEVEDVLAARPDVLEVSVVGVADEAFGQRLEAHVVPVPGAAPTAQELKRHVARTLAPFKVPRAVHIVPELPHNETGKLVRPGAGGPP